MTRTFALIAAFVGLVGWTYTSEPMVNTVTLPIEVYAANGFDATTASDGDETITINVADASAVDSLAFWMHQPYYHLGGGALVNENNGFDNERAASIQLNNGGFQVVADSTVDCAFPESRMGAKYGQLKSGNKTGNACIGGVSPTVRFNMAVSRLGSVSNGDNTLTFRFNGSKGVRSGYRVIYLAATGPSSDSLNTLSITGWQQGELLANGETTFEFDNPDNWTPPTGYDNADSISQGETLFTTRDTLTDHTRQSTPSMPGEAITAACSDCHAKNGLDLWYFNYSNETITARSRFHGLSESASKKIAAYIRNLQPTDAEGNAYNAPGYPWNPPFQPGPTMGRQDINFWDGATDAESVYWAAGAGIEDILDVPLHEGNYVFAKPNTGNPTSASGVLNKTPPTYNYYDDASSGDQQLVWSHLSSNHDTTDIKKYPVATQLPDWNTWLPDISPVGDMPDADIRNHDWWNKYTRIAGDANSTSFANSVFEHLNPNSASDMFQSFKSFRGMYDQMSLFFRPDNLGKGATSAIDAREDLSSMQYNLTKVWEITQHYDLYDYADHDIEHPQSDLDYTTYNDWDLDIGMITMGRTLFDLAPHIIGDNQSSGDESDNYHWGSYVGQKWATHIWYHAQVIADPGIAPSSRPVDWQYQDAHMTGFTGAIGIDGTIRQLLSQTTRHQVSYTDGVGVCPRCGGNSKDERIAIWAKQGQPAWAMGIHGTEGHFQLPNTSIADTLEDAVATAWMRAWWDSHKGLPVDSFQARQCDYDNEWCWELATTVPEYDSYNIVLESEKLDRFYTQLKQSVDGGMTPGIVDSVAEQWATVLWPEANENNYSGNNLNYSWEGITDYSAPIGSPPNLTLAADTSGTAISDGDTLESGVTVHIDADPSDEGSIDSVRWSFNGVYQETDTADPYEHSQTPADGTHSISASAYDNDGNKTTKSFGFTVGTETEVQWTFPDTGDLDEWLPPNSDGTMFADGDLDQLAGGASVRGDRTAEFGFGGVYDFVVGTDSVWQSQASVVRADTAGGAADTLSGQAYAAYGLRQSTAEDDVMCEIRVSKSSIATPRWSWVWVTCRDSQGAESQTVQPRTRYDLPVCLESAYDSGTYYARVQSSCSGSYNQIATHSITLSGTAKAYVRSRGKAIYGSAIVQAIVNTGSSYAIGTYKQ